MKNSMLAELLEHKVILILRGLKPEMAIRTCCVLADAGARFIEVPLNTAGALDCIRLLSQEYKNSPVHIGAGTVLNTDAVEAVYKAGGKYIISPNTDMEVIRTTRELGMLSIPGFKTPTEAFAAVNAGADVLKLFPCGSPDEIAVLKTVIPKPIFAVGGINSANKHAFLEKADGVGVGIGVFHPDMTMSELAKSAAGFFSKVQ